MPQVYRGTVEYILVYKELVTAAQYRGIVTYEDLAHTLNMEWGLKPMNLLNYILGEISDDEAQAGRPMLSAVVVRKETGKPGDGFYGKAKDLELFKGNDSEEAREQFWNRQREKVYLNWQRWPG